MENMEAKLNELEVRINEMDELTQASAKLIKILSEGMLRNAQTISDTEDRVLNLAKMILSEKEQVTAILQCMTGVSDEDLAEKESLVENETVTEDDAIPTDKNKYLVWGEYTIHPKYNIPILEMRIRHGEDGEEKTFGYVSPFRGYFFQISKSYDGEFDLASYRAQHGTMANAFRGCNRALKEDIYRGMLYSTILHCLSNNYGKDLHPSHRLMAEYMKDSPIKAFIDASIDWVEKLS